MKVTFSFLSKVQCIYFSKTRRHFLAAEDIRISNHAELRLGNDNDSAVFDHLLQFHFTFDLDHFRILATKVINFCFLVKEGLL